MRDLLNVFFGFGDRRGKSVYNLVNTNDSSFPGSNSPYNTTTTAANEHQNKANRPRSESLNAVAVLDRVLFKGKLTQEENKTKCECFLFVIEFWGEWNRFRLSKP